MKDIILTTEYALVVRKRLEEVFLAKTGNKLDCIELCDDGTFYCSYSYSVYGGTETDGETVRVEELTSDLDELIKMREDKNEKARLQRIKEREEYEQKQKEREKRERHSTYLTLKKEFEQ